MLPLKPRLQAACLPTQSNHHLQVTTKSLMASKKEEIC